MWLEGAVQNAWSVAQMRRQRWEALGTIPGEEPGDGETPTAEPDEDAEPIAPPSRSMTESTQVVRNPERQEEGRASASLEDLPREAEIEDAVPGERATPVRPFENLPTLPDDLRDAVEAMKLAILAHKLVGWREISREGVLVVLEGLKQLVLAPAE
jgi:hypothetical protein